MIEKKNSPRKALSRIWSGYSFIFIFAVIFLAYYLVNPNLT